MHRARLTMLVLGFTVALAVVGVTSAEGGGRPLSTTMSGPSERPGPGDPDATGRASFTLNQGQREVCFRISWANVDGTVNAGHIHVAPPTEPGPIVVSLFSGPLPGTASVSGCVQNVDRGLIKALRQNPAAYHVNVHSQPAFAAGAIRGQLGK